jgi:hypothetical protein
MKYETFIFVVLPVVGIILIVLLGLILKWIKEFNEEYFKEK